MVSDSCPLPGQFNILFNWQTFIIICITISQFLTFLFKFFHSFSFTFHPSKTVVQAVESSQNSCYWIIGNILNQLDLTQHRNQLFSLHPSDKSLAKWKYQYKRKSLARQESQPALKTRTRLNLFNPFVVTRKPFSFFSDLIIGIRTTSKNWGNRSAIEGSNTDQFVSLHPRQCHICTGGWKEYSHSLQKL